MVKFDSKVILFICTNLRLNSDLPSCGQSLSDEDFKKLKYLCLSKFGPEVKLVSTKCQGVCPKNHFYGTMISLNREGQKPKFFSFISLDKVLETITEELKL